jgi:hypothetical protein
MNVAPYKIVKLTNGEDIICIVKNELGEECEVSYPLLMQTLPRRTPKGFVESLSLSRWLQPFTEESLFKIKNDKIILMTDASPGLCKYYEYVLSKIDSPNDNEVFDEKNFSKEEDNDDDEEVYEELLADMDIDSNSIH